MIGKDGRMKLDFGFTEEQTNAEENSTSVCR